MGLMQAVFEALEVNLAHRASVLVPVLLLEASVWIAMWKIHMVGAWRVVAAVAGITTSSFTIGLLIARYGPDLDVLADIRLPPILENDQIRQADDLWRCFEDDRQAGVRTGVAELTSVLGNRSMKPNISRSNRAISIVVDDAELCLQEVVPTYQNPMLMKRSMLSVLQAYRGALDASGGRFSDELGYANYVVPAHRKCLSERLANEAKAEIFLGPSPLPRYPLDACNVESSHWKLAAEVLENHILILREMNAAMRFYNRSLSPTGSDDP